MMKRNDGVEDMDDESIDCITSMDCNNVSK